MMLTKGLYVQHSSEVHANAAETLAAVTRIAPSALASKLASPKFALSLTLKEGSFNSIHS